MFSTWNKIESEVLENRNLVVLFNLALKNKIPLPYLDVVRKLGKPEYEQLYTQFIEKEKTQLCQIRDLAELLSGQNISYVVFKTLKPFPYVASDVDLLFFNNNSSTKALNLFLKKGYQQLDSIPPNLTVFNSERSTKVDLYGEVTVSRIAYLDKRKLHKYITETTVFDTKVPVLTPEVELLSVIAHSFYKEQLYTLSDFYTIVANVDKFTVQQEITFVESAREQHVEYACILTLELTSLLYSFFFNKKLQKIEKILSELDYGKFVTQAIRRVLNQILKTFKLPYKYDYVTVFVGFIEKILKDENAKRCLPFQMRDSFSNPRFSARFIEEIANHILRETY